MKKVKLIVLAVVCSTFVTSAQTIKKDRMLFVWKNMKNMVVNSAKAMPEKHYDLVPAEGLRSFADQVKHITTSNRFFIAFLAGEDVKAANQNTLEQVKGKADIIRDLEQSFDYVLATLPKIKRFDEHINMFGQTVTRMEGLMLMEHHLHREQGKITIYMRMKGVAPAKSTSWLL